MGKKLRVMLGDLRHETIGRHNVYIPLQIGYIGSYLLSQFESGCIDLRIYSEIDELDKDINNWKPDVIGLTNYVWNSSVSKLMCKFAKQNIPNVLCVLGGPEFPTDNEERKHYLSERPEVDIYVYGDGEIAFANLVKKYLESGASNIDKLKSNANDGAISISHETGGLVVGQPVKRFHDMDLIPSPYLNGLLDKWLVGDYMPTIETTRGCPFKCTYCFDSINQFVSRYSIRRIIEELNYIVKTAEHLETKGLLIADTNFGIYALDLQTSDYLGEVIEKVGWPAIIELGGTGKQNMERTLECRRRAKNKFSIGLSRQSMNPETCKIIKRRNYPMRQFLELSDLLSAQGQHPVTEVIVPMPAETKKSYFGGQRMLIDAGVFVGTWTTMMLKGTSLSSKESREKYQLQTKYRILPRQFGTYHGEKCFETEEICVSTNTMSFEEYIECRSFSLFSGIFTHQQFDIIHKHIEDLELSYYDFIVNILSKVKSKTVCLSEIYDGFVQESCDELFDSPKKIYEYFSQNKNYDSLLNSEKGDNLLRKYLTKMFFCDWKGLVELVYEVLEETYKKTFSQKTPEYLNSAKRWVIAMRNISNLFQDESIVDLIQTIELPYDILSWYETHTIKQEELSEINSNSNKTISSGEKVDYFEGYTTDISSWREKKKRSIVDRKSFFNKESRSVYRIQYNQSKIAKYFEQLNTLWGGRSYEYMLGNMLWRGWPIDNLWCVCERAKC